MREPLPQCMLFYNAFLAYVHSRIFGKEKKRKIRFFLPTLPAPAAPPLLLHGVGGEEGGGTTGGGGAAAAA